MSDKITGKRFLNASDEDVRNVVELYARLSFTPEEIEDDDNVTFHGYIDPPSGILFTRIVEIDKRNKVFFEEKFGQFGAISFKQIPKTYIFVGRESEADRFRPAFTAKFEGHALDLNRAVIRNGELCVRVIGLEDLKFSLKK